MIYFEIEHGWPGFFSIPGMVTDRKNTLLTSRDGDLVVASVFVEREDGEIVSVTETFPANERSSIIYERTALAREIVASVPQHRDDLAREAHLVEVGESKKVIISLRKKL